MKATEDVPSQLTELKAREGTPSQLRELAFWRPEKVLFDSYSTGLESRERLDS